MFYTPWGMQRCPICGKLYYLSVPHCPYCGGGQKVAAAILEIWKKRRK